MATDSVENAQPQAGQVSVDMNKVFASYQRQIAEQAHQIAVKDAMNEALQETVKSLREMLDSAVQAPVAPTNNGKKKT